jgi:predicted RNA polymerase sigma factor
LKEPEEARAAVEAVARRSYGKLVALLAVRTRDVAAAEDALADALASALTDWAARGVPRNPEGWLVTTARHRLIDALRRRARAEALNDEERLVETWEAESDDPIPDRRLALLFACAHPAIEAEIRAPLMLQTVLGIDAGAIAAAFLVAPSTMGKRLVRAKQKIKRARIPFEIPQREELAGRVAAVLEAIYAAFGEGWTDPTDLRRRDLAEEALFLARLAAELLPKEPEALGLLALLLHAHARRRARRDARGEFVPLAGQDLEAWDWAAIEEAEGLLLRAAELGRPGRFQIEAALQSAHVERRRTGVANWTAVVRLYDTLLALAPSPVVAINRAMAVAERDGAEPALAALPDPADEPRLAEYQPYWAARAELLARHGAKSEARDAYQLAIGLERDPAVRRFLQRRQAACES